MPRSLALLVFLSFLVAVSSDRIDEAENLHEQAGHTAHHLDTHTAEEGQHAGHNVLDHKGKDKSKVMTMAMLMANIMASDMHSDMYSHQHQNSHETNNEFELEDGHGREGVVLQQLGEGQRHFVHDDHDHVHADPHHNRYNEWNDEGDWGEGGYGDDYNDGYEGYENDFDEWDIGHGHGRGGYHGHEPHEDDFDHGHDHDLDFDDDHGDDITGQMFPWIIGH